MGGPWTPSMPGAAGTRPGFYVNFIQQAGATVLPGVRGIVGIISEHNWGDPNVVHEIASLSEAAAEFGARESATDRLYNLIRFAFAGGALTVKAIRVLNTTNAVKSTLSLNDTDGGAGTNVIRIDAKHVGTFGDEISVDVSDDPVDATKTRIRVYVEGALVHTVTSTVNHGVAGFVDNVIALIQALESPWIDVTKLADGTNDLANVTTATALAGGANGDAVTSTQFNTALALFGADKVHQVTTDSAVGSIQTAIAAWVDDRREEGYYVMAVLGSDTGDSASTIISDAQGFNNEAVVYVGPGITAEDIDGETATYNGAQTAAIVAGIIAGLPNSGSPTFAALPLSTGVETNLTNAQVSSMLAGGVLAITPAPSGVARIERGITTLYNPGVDDIAAYKKIRTLRTVDGIADGLAIAGQNNFIGRVLNDDPGKRAVIDAVRDFLRVQAANRAILDTFTVEIDSTQDNDGDAIFVNIGITPIEAIEFIFATVRLN